MRSIFRDLDPGIDRILSKMENYKFDIKPFFGIQSKNPNIFKNVEWWLKRDVNNFQNVKNS